MPAQSIWMIRSSLMCLIAASIAGGIILVHKSAELHPAVWLLLPLHYELAIWGWLVQFVMGTAYWMFPRYVTGAKRGSSSAAWAMAALFNTGLLLLLASGLLRDGDLVAVSGRCLLTLSVVVFVFLMWKRAVSYRDHER